MVIEPITILTKKGIPMTQPYYKEYRNLTFDIVRFSQQIKHWNHLKQKTIKMECCTIYTKPFLLKEQTRHCPESVVFKQLCHCVDKALIHPSYKEKSPQYDAENNIFFISDYYCEIINDDSTFFNRTTPPLDYPLPNNRRPKRPLRKK
ncbi:uncharacterized protein OCT59_024381 [Rhizophagus irregularis]|uniref:uncharacterized protein n=1 Tax=Rhizophagus irregularis TaxID=588596 RepID=UPI0019F21176|nr:hypothetical protein OCT59_024381 [Rhizophagus irregularis]GBC47661.2 hypothetical protein GLOIN_2v1780643 [Rhizophagus irregularis DAOM 181602=DAOM 197198]